MDIDARYQKYGVRKTEKSLECSCCPWVGYEKDAVEREDPEDGTLYDCPECGEECAHTPLDETEDLV